MNQKLCLVVILGMLLEGMMPEGALALEPTVTSVRKYWSGPAKMVALKGTYQRSNKDETLSTVRVVMLDANYRDLSGARGSFDRSTKTWSGGVGDFRAVYYRAEFYVNTSAGLKVFRTAAQRW